MARKRIFSRFADVDGDGTGSIDGAVNASGTPVTLKVTAQPGEVITITRMIVSVVSATINNIDVYADAGALTNGVQVFVTDIDGTLVYNLTDPGHKIKTLGHWAHYCYDYQFWAGLAGGDDHAAVRWTFAKSGEAVVLLPGWSLCVLLEDALQALTTHQFMVQGHYEDDSLSGGAIE
jgi:hypothetical protein